MGEKGQDQYDMKLYLGKPVELTLSHGLSSGFLGNRSSLMCNSHIQDAGKVLS